MTAVGARLAMRRTSRSYDSPMSGGSITAVLAAVAGDCPLAEPGGPPLRAPCKAARKPLAEGTQHLRAFVPGILNVPVEYPDSGPGPAVGDNTAY
jgi:hypothetical protein